jgi:hypothetical protein
MKRVLALLAAMTLCTSTAFAVGCDLSVYGCPGDSGATYDAGSLDCAGGITLMVLATWMPAEDLPDLGGIDAIFDVYVYGDVGSDATFWDFSGSNSNAVTVSHVRPDSPGCNAYRNTWGLAGSGATSQSLYRSPSLVRIMATCFRPSGLHYTPNMKMWGLQLLIDTSTSTDATPPGAGIGCTKPACMVLNSIQPRAVSGNDGQALVAPSTFGNVVVTNRADAISSCTGDPVIRHTWGRLKSLYR